MRNALAASLLVLLAVEMLQHTPFTLPNPTPLLLATVVLCSFIWGLAGGLVSAVVALVYCSFQFSRPGFLFQYTPYNARHLLVMTLTTFVMAILTWVLKRHTEDIEHAKRDAQVQHERQKYSRLVEQFPGVVFICSGAAPYSPSYLSPGIAAFGYTPEQWTGKESFWQDCIHADDLPVVVQTIDQACSENRSWRVRYRFRHSNGNYRFVEEIGTHYVEEGNLFESGFFWDIEELKQVENQLRQAQKMDTIGHLAGGIAHDFNNMLTAITGYGELLEMAFEDNDPRLEDLRHMLQAAEKAGALTRQLLAFSRKQQLSPVLLDLNQLIENMVSLVQRVLGRRYNLTFVPGHALGMINADPVQLEQVLMNLLINARDSMAEGGDIQIETQNVMVDQEYVRMHPNTIAGRYVLLSVTDAGCGMDDTVLSRIFEPFYTTKEEGKGSGLGLATCYGIVAQHQGAITVYSEVGRGTVFKVYLPIVETRASDVKYRLHGPSIGGTETIILAEDEDALRALSERVLRQLGYNVHAVRNGKEALEVYRQLEGRIDLIVTDLVMQQMDGKELLKAVSSITGGTVPFIFMSGYTADSLYKTFLLDAELEFISKPISPGDLGRKVREVLDRSAKAPA